jgi:hypothetical protein
MPLIESWRDLALAGAGVIGVVVAIAHGFAMQRRIVRPLNALLDSSRVVSRAGANLVAPLLHVSTFTWLVGGLLLIVAAARLQGEARVLVSFYVGGIYLYAAIMNAWATRGRHVGWPLMSLALILLVAGAYEIP